MKNNSIKIEELKDFSKSDADDVRKLVAQLGDTYQPLTDSVLKELISSPTTHLFVARDSKTGQITGMGTLALYRIPYLKKAYLDDFIVSDGYQGQGIGSQLMKTILAFAKESGAAYIEFTSNPGRVGANKFYEKQGFKKRDTNVYRLDLTYAKSK